MSSWTYMNIKGQGQSLTLVQGHSDSTFSFFFLRNCLPDGSQNLCGASMGCARKFYQMVYIIWPSWPPCPYVVKKIKKSSSLEPKGRWPCKLVCSIGYSSTTKLDQMMSLGWPWPVLCHGQILSLMFLYGKKVKQWFFSETVVVCYIKVGRCSQLNEYMKPYEYQRSRSFIDLDPNHSDSIFLNVFSSITADFNISSALRWAIQD